MLDQDTKKDLIELKKLKEKEYCAELAVNLRTIIQGINSITFNKKNFEDTTEEINIVNLQSQILNIAYKICNLFKSTVYGYFDQYVFTNNKSNLTNLENALKTLENTLDSYSNYPSTGNNAKKVFEDVIKDTSEFINTLLDLKYNNSEPALYALFDLVAGFQTKAGGGSGGLEDFYTKNYPVYLKVDTLKNMSSGSSFTMDDVSDIDSILAIRERIMSIGETHTQEVLKDYLNKLYSRDKNSLNEDQKGFLDSLQDMQHNPVELTYNYLINSVDENNKVITLFSLIGVFLTTFERLRDLNEHLSTEKRIDKADIYTAELVKKYINESVTILGTSTLSEIKSVLNKLDSFTEDSNEAFYVTSLKSTTDKLKESNGDRTDNIADSITYEITATNDDKVITGILTTNTMYTYAINNQMILAIYFMLCDIMDGNTSVSSLISRDTILNLTDSKDIVTDICKILYYTLSVSRELDYNGGTRTIRKNNDKIKEFLEKYGKDITRNAGTLKVEVDFFCQLKKLVEKERKDYSDSVPRTDEDLKMYARSYLYMALNGKVMKDTENYTSDYIRKKGPLEIKDTTVDPRSKVSVYNTKYIAGHVKEVDDDDSDYCSINDLNNPDKWKVSDDDIILLRNYYSIVVHPFIHVDQSTGDIYYIKPGDMKDYRTPDMMLPTIAEFLYEGETPDDELTGYITYQTYPETYDKYIDDQDNEVTDTLPSVNTIRTNIETSVCGRLLTDPQNTISISEKISFTGYSKLFDTTSKIDVEDYTAGISTRKSTYTLEDISKIRQKEVSNNNLKVPDSSILMSTHQANNNRAIFSNILAEIKFNQPTIQTPNKQPAPQKVLEIHKKSDVDETLVDIISKNKECIITIGDTGRDNTTLKLTSSNGNINITPVSGNQSNNLYPIIINYKGINGEEKELGRQSEISLPTGGKQDSNCSMNDQLKRYIEELDAGYEKHKVTQYDPNIIFNENKEYILNKYFEVLNRTIENILNPSGNRIGGRINAMLYSTDEAERNRIQNIADGIHGQHKNSAKVEVYKNDLNLLYNVVYLIAQCCKNTIPQGQIVQNQNSIENYVTIDSYSNIILTLNNLILSKETIDYDKVTLSKLWGVEFTNPSMGESASVIDLNITDQEKTTEKESLGNNRLKFIYSLYCVNMDRLRNEEAFKYLAKTKVTENKKKESTEMKTPDILNLTLGQDGNFIIKNKSLDWNVIINWSAEKDPTEKKKHFIHWMSSYHNYLRSLITIVNDKNKEGMSSLNSLRIPSQKKPRLAGIKKPQSQNSNNLTEQEKFDFLECLHIYKILSNYFRTQPTETQVLNSLFKDYTYSVPQTQSYDLIDEVDITNPQGLTKKLAEKAKEKGYIDTLLPDDIYNQCDATAYRIANLKSINESQAQLLEKLISTSSINLSNLLVNTVVSLDSMPITASRLQEITETTDLKNETEYDITLMSDSQKDGYRATIERDRSIINELTSKYTAKGNNVNFNKAATEAANPNGDINTLVSLINSLLTSNILSQPTDQTRFDSIVKTLSDVALGDVITVEADNEKLSVELATEIMTKINAASNSDIEKNLLVRRIQERLRKANKDKVKDFSQLEIAREKIYPQRMNSNDLEVVREMIKDIANINNIYKGLVPYINPDRVFDLEDKYNELAEKYNLKLKPFSDEISKVQPNVYKTANILFTYSLKSPTDEQKAKAHNYMQYVDEYTLTQNTWEEDLKNSSPFSPRVLMNDPYAVLRYFNKNTGTTEKYQEYTSKSSTSGTINRITVKEFDNIMLNAYKYNSPADDVEYNADTDVYAISDQASDDTEKRRLVELKSLSCGDQDVVITYSGMEELSKIVLPKDSNTEVELTECIIHRKLARNDVAITQIKPLNIIDYINHNSSKEFVAVENRNIFTDLIGCILTARNTETMNSLFMSLIETIKKKPKDEIKDITDMNDVYKRLTTSMIAEEISKLPDKDDIKLKINDLRISAGQTVSAGNISDAVAKAKDVLFKFIKDNFPEDELISSEGMKTPFSIFMYAAFEQNGYTFNIKDETCMIQEPSSDKMNTTEVPFYEWLSSNIELNKSWREESITIDISKIFDDAAVIYNTNRQETREMSFQDISYYIFNKLKELYKGTSYEYLLEEIEKANHNEEYVKEKYQCFAVNCNCTSTQNSTSTYSNGTEDTVSYISNGLWDIDIKLISQFLTICYDMLRTNLAEYAIISSKDVGEIYKLLERAIMSEFMEAYIPEYSQEVDKNSAQSTSMVLSEHEKKLSDDKNIVPIKIGTDNSEMIVTKGIDDIYTKATNLLDDTANMVGERKPKLTPTTENSYDTLTGLLNVVSNLPPQIFDMMASKSMEYNSTDKLANPTQSEVTSKVSRKSDMASYEATHRILLNTGDDVVLKLFNYHSY